MILALLLLVNYDIEEIAEDRFNGIVDWRSLIGGDGTTLTLHLRADCRRPYSYPPSEYLKWHLIV